MKALRIAIGVVLAAGIAACADASSPVLPADASFDGIHTLGSGGGAPPAPTGSAETMSSDAGGHTLGSGSGVTTPPAGSAETTSSDTTARGGHTLGGGA